ncbi:MULTISPECIES: FAD-dependent oxidoreductase [Carnobacterium]|uniref:Glycine/D-amino acid oxidase n=1 Tax=Carnobacterium alterfunditum TaxID=28230 RepID=A0A1N6FIL5_9LACT|nr:MULTISPECIES: FAD-dependent oxidoreductase [Carnobacterium]MBT2732335.1 FAD-binding oxidoreductase [Carnobacterium sp. ISL-102]SIN95092.1 Glycine/D-amino acid oxidase [Carnobacterium alterfunditum]
MTQIKRIAVIGGGIVGATAAFYLSQKNYEVAIYDDGVGQATSAAAGIICPWLSQRRNKEWYQLASKGAAFYPQLMRDLNEPLNDSDIYQQVGTLVFKKKPSLLKKLEQLALKRLETAPEIGEISLLSPKEIKAKFPLYGSEESALFASGGARVDGSLLTKKLIDQAKSNGAHYYPEKITLSQTNSTEYLISSATQERTYDTVVLAVGAWLPELLDPLDLAVDIRPQKGQLVQLHLHEDMSQWPVIMPDGEKDIIPFANGKIVVGATHENDGGYDLTATKEKLDLMLEEAIELAPGLKNATITGIRVGTRAYTSDFAPFFGAVPGYPNLFTASGLGSSGLTSGPLIGHMLSQIISGESTDLPLSNYPVEHYIKKR